MKSDDRLCKLVLVGLGLAAVLGAGCERSQRESFSAAVRVAAILPLTGPAAFYGEWCKMGMDLATKETNASGGLRGEPFEILYGDSKNEPREGVSLANKFLLNRVPLVFSAMTGVSFSMLPVLESRGIVEFMTIVTHPEAADKSPWAFRYYVNKGAAAKLMAKYAFRQLGLRRIAVLYINDEGGLGEKRSFAEAFSTLGGVIVTEESYDKTIQDLRPSILRVNSAQPQGIYFSGYGRIYGVGLRQMRELGVRAQVLASYEPLYRATRDLAGEALEGVIFSAPTLNSRSQFFMSFEKQYARRPEIDAAFCYDSVRIVTSAIARASPDPAAIRTALLGLKDFDGVFGSVRMLPNGDVRVPISINKIQNGRAVSLVRPSRS